MKPKLWGYVRDILPPGNNWRLDRMEPTFAYHNNNKSP